MDDALTNTIGTEEAAAFLGLSQAGVRYHLYRVKDLRPDFRDGNKILFLKDTLVEFNKRKRKPGRPGLEPD